MKSREADRPPAAVTTNALSSDNKIQPQVRVEKPPPRLKTVVDSEREICLIKNKKGRERERISHDGRSCRRFASAPIDQHRNLTGWWSPTSSSFFISFFFFVCVWIGASVYSRSIHIVAFIYYSFPPFFFFFFKYLGMTSKKETTYPIKWKKKKSFCLNKKKRIKFMRWVWWRRRI